MPLSPSSRTVTSVGAIFSMLRSTCSISGLPAMMPSIGERGSAFAQPAVLGLELADLLAHG